MPVEQLFLEVFERLIIELILLPQRPIGDPAALLQERGDTVH